MGHRAQRVHKAAVLVVVLAGGINHLAGRQSVSRIAGGQQRSGNRAGVHGGRPGLGLVQCAAELNLCAQRLDLAEVDIKLQTAVNGRVGVAHTARGDEDDILAGGVVEINLGGLSGVDDQRLGAIVIGCIGGILGHCAETFRCLVAIGQQGEMAVARQFEINAQLYLRRRGVLHVLRVLHLVHIGMVVEQLGRRIVLRHIAGGHAVAVFLVRIEVVQSRCLRVESDTSAQRHPLRHVERHVQSGREGVGGYVAEGLHRGEAQSGSGFQFVHLIDVPGEAILRIGRQLVQGGNVAEGARAAVGIRAVGMAVVLVVVTLTVVPVVAVVGTHLEALDGLSLAQEETVVHLQEKVARAALGDTGGEVRLCHPRHLIVAGLHGGDDGNHAAAAGNIRRVLRVGLAEAQSGGIRQGAHQWFVYLYAAVVRQVDIQVFVLKIGSVVDGVGVVAAPVFGIHHAHLGVGVPLLGDVVAIAHVQRVAVVRAGLLPGVSPCLCIVGIDVQDARLAQVEALAQRVVHGRGVDLGFCLPGGHSHFRVDHHQSAGQVAVFCRRNAADDLHLVDVVGRHLSKVSTGECRARERALRHVTVVRHRHAVDHDAASEGTGVVVHQRAQLQVRLRGEVLVAHQLTGNELHDIGQRVGLQVVDGLAPHYRTGGGAALVALGRHGDFLQCQRGGRHLELQVQVALHLYRGSDRFEADITDTQRVGSGRNILECGLTVHIGNGHGTCGFQLAGTHNDGLLSAFLGHFNGNRVAAVPARCTLLGVSDNTCAE